MAAAAVMEPDASRSSRARFVAAIAAAFLLTLGFDLLLHAGLLAPLYTEPSPFLLDAEQAFRRIPLGYAAFLGATIALAWLLRRLGVRGAGRGFRVGLASGAAVWGIFVVGLYSISTAPPALLLGWWLGQATELALAGAVLGAAAAGTRMRRVWGLVVVGVLVCVVATVVLQTLGVAPTMKRVR